MSAAAPTASVIIPTHKRRQSLRRALLALAEQSLASGDYEVVVSIDGSRDGTAEMLAELAVPYALRVVEGPRRGRAAACNAALALARGEVVVVLDDDMLPAPKLLERHLAHHPPGSRLCVLGAVPIELDRSSPRAARYVRDKFNAHLANLARADHEFVPRDFYSGNASLGAGAMREVGGFNESFTAYGNEDVDLFLRLRAAGIGFRYDPEAQARQSYDKDLRALARDTVEKGRTTVLLAGSHPETFEKLRLADPWDGSRPWLAVRSILLWLSQRLPASRRAVLSGATLLERLGLWRQPLFYRATLDYAFWAGVTAALRESKPEGELDRLAWELRRGPIDLLLHR